MSNSSRLISLLQLRLTTFKVALKRGRERWGIAYTMPGTNLSVGKMFRCILQRPNQLH